MANRNDFKLLNAKCIQIYSNILSTLGLDKPSLGTLPDIEKGDFKDAKPYKYSIGKERLGQLLLATKQGRPEIATNKKREIFDNWYDQLFIFDSDLLSMETVDLIFVYQNIDRLYRKSQYNGSVQKSMYIAYLKYMLPTKNLETLILEFETFLSNYIKNNPKDQSPSRYLIMLSFKDSLDNHYGIK